MIKQKDLVYLLGSSVILTAVWMGSSFYHADATSTIDDVLATQVQPIAPRFNEQVLNTLSQRRTVPPSYELSGAASSPSADILPPPDEFTEDEFEETEVVTSDETIDGEATTETEDEAL